MSVNNVLYFSECRNIQFQSFFSRLDNDEAERPRPDEDVFSRAREYEKEGGQPGRDFGSVEVVLDEERYRIQADRAGGGGGRGGGGGGGGRRRRGGRQRGDHHEEEEEEEEGEEEGVQGGDKVGGGLAFARFLNI